MVHPALLECSHRPWPLPQHPWRLTMDWEDLLFLHWPVDAALLQRHLPAGVQIETFDGQAWLGVVPFRMKRTRWRALPPIPTAHTFLELNVRTYVRAADRSGVWFFSLDAASWLTVIGARLSFGLPYFHARMHSERRDDGWQFDSERRDRRAPAARFAGTWTAAGVPVHAEPGTFEHFLVERYCLFTMRRGQLLCGDIAHAPWRLTPASVQLEHNDLTSLLGCRLDGPAGSALVAEPLTVVAYWPVAWPLGRQPSSA